MADKHQYHSTLHARTLEYIMDNDLLDPRLENSVEILRGQIQYAMIESFNSEVTSIQRIFNNIKKLLRSVNGTPLARSLERSEDNNYNEPNRNLMQYIWDLSPDFAAASFVTFDQQYNNFNEKIWRVLITSYTFGNIIWKAFEHARACLYKAHYTHLYTQLQTINTDNTGFLQAFDKYGYLAPENRSTYLPEPSCLSTIK